MTTNAPAPLPQGWQPHKLGDCVRLINGRAYSQHELLDSGTPVIRIQNLNGGDRWYYSDLNLPEDKYCHRGDLLFAWSASFGPYIWNGEKSIFHYHIWRVIPNELLDKAFAFRLFDWITARVKSASHGVAMLHMTKAGMEAWPIALPPLPEQRRIAAILDQADALRAKRREALAQLDSLTQSIFVEMFGDNRIAKTRISELLKANVLLLHKDGNHGSLYPRADDFGDSGVPFLSAKCINELGEIDGDKIEHLKTNVALSLKIGWIESGDVLLSHNASVGKVALYDGRFGKALIGTSLTAFRPNPTYLDSLFLAASLQGNGFQGQLMSNMGQTTRNQVPITAQRELALVVPPIGSQRKYSEKVSTIWKQRNLHRIASAELDTLFASLQHRAFQGEL